MRAATRALAVIGLGAALALGGAPAALAVPCPPGTYPPGQDCTISDGTTGGQPTPDIVVPEGNPVGSPTPEPSESPAPDDRAESPVGDDEGLGLDLLGYGLGAAGGLLFFGTLFFVISRRRAQQDEAQDF